MTTLDLPLSSMQPRPARDRDHDSETDLDPLVLRRMPIAVPLVAALLCACIAAIWLVIM